MDETADRKHYRKGNDPTVMSNQPALRTSSGLIWLVMGGLFAFFSLIPLFFPIFFGDGRSHSVAIPVAIAVVVCYTLMVLARIVQPRGPRRLKLMAAAMIAMAGIALIGVWVSAAMEAASLT